jgi:hypothetical protein
MDTRPPKTLSFLIQRGDPTSNDRLPSRIPNSVHSSPRWIEKENKGLNLREQYFRHDLRDFCALLRQILRPKKSLGKRVKRLIWLNRLTLFPFSTL